MTPQFALSLSVDGIKLLHRVSGGWHVVGEIGLDTADLSAAMADLRAKGEAIGPAPLRTKLLIPDDQIKYLAIDSTQTTEDDVHRALDGTTPYAIHELVIDFDRAGGRTHVAAVARDTLAEAEAFAVEHDFGPVCFAGIAAPYTFRSEIFFGPTAAAEDLLAPGETPMRDDSSVAVIGVAKPKADGAIPAAAPLPDLPGSETAEPAPTPTPDVADTVAVAPEDDLPVFASRHRTSPPEGETKPADDATLETPAAAPTVPPEAAAVQPTFDEIPDDTTQEARVRPEVPAPIPTPPPDEEPLFTPQDDTPREAPGPVARAPRATSAPADEPLFTRRPPQDSATTDMPPAPSAPRAPLSANRSDSVADGFASIRARNDMVASRSTPVADDTVFENSTPDQSASQTETPPVPSLFASRPEAGAPPEPRETSGGKGLAALDAMAGSLKPRRKAKAEPAKVDPEAEKMTVFGQRKGQSVGGKPKYLGLLMTIGLLIFLFLVALWANTLTEDGIAGWFKRDQLVPIEEPVVEIASAPAAEPEPEPDPTPTENASVGTPAPSALTESDREAESTRSTPVVRAATGRVLSPAEADRIYAATGVYQRAPRLPVEPREATLEGFQEYAALPAVQDPPQPGLPDAVPLASDLPLQPQPVPPPAGTTYQRDLRGFILATPEGTVTPQGVLVVAGAPEFAPPARPGTEPVAVPVPVPDAAAPEAQTEGLILISGRPPIIPPLRPDDLAPEAETDAEDAETIDDPTTAAENGDPSSEEETAEGQPETQADPDAALVVVEGAPDTEPPLRPTSIGALDEAALDDASAPETPEGLIVIAGRPDLTPPLRPLSVSAQATPDPAVVVNPADAVTPGGISLASFKPSGRPGALVPAAPIADPALVGFRPSVRPDALAPETDTDSEDDITEPDLTAVLSAIAQAAPQSAFNNVTDTAIRRSPMPGARPTNFNQVVSNARSIQERQTTAAASTPTPPPEQETASAPAATAVSNATVAPTGPVSGGVARAATVDNAIRMRDMNLIGVYGRPNARRALIRMGNGRYVKVEVGSALDGGRVTAIGDSALNFVKSGRTYALQLPNG